MSRDARRASFTNGAWRVFELSLGEMLWSRRTIFMAIVVGSPVILALIARIVQATGIAPLRVNGVRVDAAGMFGLLSAPSRVIEPMIALSIAYVAIENLLVSELKSWRVGLVFAFGWEQLALIMPGYLRRFTLAYYLQSLVPHAMPSDSVVSLLQGVFADSPSVLISLLCLAAATAASLALAGRVVERREYVLDQ